MEARRKLLLTSFYSATGLLLGACFAWWWLICYQPTFWVRAYERVAMYNPSKLSKFHAQLAQLQRQWDQGGTFQLELAEDGVTTWCHRVVEGSYFRVLPGGVTWPLVAFRRDGVRLGFQDRSSLGWPVISMRIQPRLIDGGRVLMEVSELRCGRVPRSGCMIRRFVEQAWVGHGFRLEWAGCTGSQAWVILHLPSDLVERGLCLTRFESVDDRFLVAGESPRTAAAYAVFP
jgi:hypothetical protein